jgi:hypothetical protein
MKSTSHKDKVQVTLGELYRRMSADFRAVRPADHAACVMPMVVASDDEAGANWRVEPLTSFCPFCNTLSQMIVSEYAPHFQVRYFPQPSRDAGPFAPGCYCAAD